MIATADFAYVQEPGEQFCTLFPHRFDYIYAQHPEVGEKPNWQTESRYPLADRVLLQGDLLYGVRFGSQTRYCLLDIDATSVYHPKRDALAIARILSALEPLGLVASLVCTSSYSGGLHVYFPFQQAQRSWEIAAVVSGLLEQGGFKLKAGQLEVFPNPRAYAADGKFSLFNAHRLPLQTGSYLLNEDYQPVWGDRAIFLQQWKFAQDRNEINQSVFRRILKQKKCKSYQLSGRADQFLSDLNAEIEIGWTGSGQTNRLLGRIALRAYVFHSVLTGTSPLNGQALVDEIVRVARSLPGYTDWCSHQHEIEQRASEWARCVEESRYFPYSTGLSKKNSKDQGSSEESNSERLTWNQKQAGTARGRIQQAIAKLLNNASLPATATARFQALTHLGIGGSTLYRHRDLWHPNYLTGDLSVDATVESPVETVENPPYPPALENNRQEDCVNHTSSCLCCTSLLVETGRNALQQEECGDCSLIQSSTSDRNSSVEILCLKDQPPNLQLERPNFLLKQKIEENKAVFRSAQQAMTQHKQQIHQQSQHSRMQQYLESGDPILMAEAQAWKASHPKVSAIEQVHEASALPELLPTQEQEDLDDSPSTPTDFSDVLAVISVHLRRSQWSAEEVGDRLFIHFGKRKQAMLSDAELCQWASYLESWVH